MKRFIAKLRLRLAKWTYRNLNLETKFNIGDIVVTTYNESYSPFEDGSSISGRGEVVDIYMGSRMHSQKDWYYKVFFTDDTAQLVHKTKVDFNHWEIKLDKAYLREQKLKELGI